MSALNPFRVGFGYDIHRLGEGRSLVLGGILIDTERGCIAHSDGDVLLHAICDALLGAIGDGDIGVHFPDTDSDYRGISSLELTRRVMDLVRGAGYRVGNVDATIILQRPKIMHRRGEMAASIAAVLGVESTDVSIKATTAEGLGPLGAAEGVEAHAVALLMREV